MDWHPDGSRVASAGADLSVKIWNPANGDVLLSLPVEKPIKRLEWSSDGTMLAAMDSDGTILVWDASHGRQVASSDRMLAHQMALSNRKCSDALNREDWATASSILENIAAHSDLSDTLDFYRLTLLAAYLADQESYVLNCKRILDQLPEQAAWGEQYFAAWACALAPDGLDDYFQVIELSQLVVDAAADSQQYVSGHAAILFRAGKYDQARKLLRGCLNSESSTSISQTYIQYFLAMTEHELGNRDAALEQLDRANAAAQTELETVPVWNRRLTIELLQREANALIRSNPSGN